MGISPALLVRLSNKKVWFLEIIKKKKELQRAHLNFASSLDFEDETGMKRSRSPLQDQISFLAGGLGGGVGEKDKRNQLGPTNTPVTVSSKSN